MVRLDRAADVDAREHREDVGLERGNEAPLEQVERHRDGHPDGGDEDVAEMMWRIMKFIPSDGEAKASESSVPDDLDADSLALIELVEALEEEVGRHVPGFHIDDEDLEDLKTVRDAVDYVLAKL